MISGELITLVTQELMGLASNFDSTDYANAVNEALRETGWAFPVSEDFHVTWLKRRAKRHLFEYMLTGSATKFKFEQINSQQKFEHFEKLVTREDAAFEKVKESESYRFASVAACQMFGTRIDAGFAYDRAGQDLTYDTDNVVIITPSDSDE